MSEPGHAIVMHRFEVAAERVFDACLDPAWVRRWILDPQARDDRVVRLALEARVGGRFSCAVDRAGTEIEYVGEYRAIDRPQLLVFTWAARDGQPDRSRVVIEISPRGEGCEVKLTHILGGRWSTAVDDAAGAWARRLDALARAIAEEAALA